MLWWSYHNLVLEHVFINFSDYSFRYLRSVSILTFMNKIDILKEKIERGANFAAALEKMKQEASNHCSAESMHSDYDRQIYRKLLEILEDNPYQSFKVTGVYNMPSMKHYNPFTKMRQRRRRILCNDFDGNLSEIKAVMTNFFH